MFSNIAVFPVVLTLVFCIAGMAMGRSFGVLDFMIFYTVSLVVIAPAAAATAIYHARYGPKLPAIRDVTIYALLGATGSTLLMVWLDHGDDYFSPPGVVGWIWPAFGAALGAAFGATFRIAYIWLGPRLPGLQR
ncbi:hypothetical protein ACHMW7_28650 [Aminobacter sp. UC22_36]|uniref:hypothetical protein n=1 Tax=Aminobacter sp. UC22_36 TaxID=3374549 RepID=UPI0037581AA0